MSPRCRKYYVDCSVLGHPELSFITDAETLRKLLEYIYRRGLPCPKIECID